jgi:hypothetical protein
MEYNPIYKFKLNREGKFSITKPFESNQIIMCIKKIVGDLNNIIITDATSCMGGDLINFSKVAKMVNGVEINKENFILLRENCATFNCKNIKLYNEDYLNVYKTLNQDIIYIDPQWGGPEYKEKNGVVLYLGKYKLEYLLDKFIEEKITDYIFVKVPLNVSLPEKFYENSQTIFNKNKKPSFILLCIR